MNKNSRARGYRRCALAAMSGLALALAACGSDSNDDPATSEPSATIPQVSSSKPSSTPATSTSSEAPEPSAPAVPEPEVEEPVAVASFECGDWHLYQAGTAIYSDGSTGYEESCYQPMMDAAVAGGGGQPDPATIPYADGGTCPAYLCGYGHDENGNPNPTSGELQTQHGCEEGYITDPELFAAVAERFAE